jgi:hypothetical protein
MRDAAAASCLSIGGLNHYFPTKTALLFWPLSPTTCKAASEDFARQFHVLRERDPAAFFQEFVESTVAAILSCTPAMQATIERGSKEFWDVMVSGMTPAPLVALFEQTRSPLASAERNRLTRGIRRSFLGATLDPDVSYEELHGDVWRQLDGVNLASEDSADVAPVLARTHQAAQ